MYPAIRAGYIINHFLQHTAPAGAAEAEATAVSTAADVVAGVLGVLFVFSGGMKLAGPKVIRDNFEHWRYPASFRVFTGVWEVAGAALLLAGIPFHPLGVAGAGLILAAMVGAIYTHVVRVPEPRAAVLPTVLLAGAAAATVLLAASL